jgi:hypothetical protein
VAIPSKQARETLHGLIFWHGGWIPSIQLVLVVIHSKYNWLNGFINAHLSFYVVLFAEVVFEITN